jgi:hypothetical protein
MEPSRFQQLVDRAMGSETLQSDDDARERRFWGMILRLVWTALIILAVAGVLATLTLALNWTPYLLLGGVGTLAGLSLLPVLLGPPRGRVLTGFILGVIAFPLLAAWLTSLAATSPATFTAYSTGLAPFLAHAAGAVFAGCAIARLWRERPDHPSDVPAVATHAPDEGGAP